MSAAPDPDDPLTRLSGWCAQALKAVELAKLQSPGLTNAMRKAAAGFQNNYASDTGAFLYTNSGDEKGGALTGVGVLCLQFLARGKDASVAGGLRRLEQATCNWKAPWVGDPLYAWYYVTQAKFQAGGRAWKRWNAEFWPQLVNHQIVISNAIEGPDGKPADIGYWPSASGRELGRSYVYNTTLCALTLEVYYRYLPTYGTLEQGEDTATIEEDRNEVPIRVL